MNARILTTLVDSLGTHDIVTHRLRDGENRGACPKCARGPSDDALAVRIQGDHACLICHRCQWTGAVSAANDSGVRQGKAPKPPLPPKPRKGYDLARSIWLECVHLSDTPGANYLHRRACVVPRDDGDIRFHPRLFCAKVGRTLPAMVCRVSTVEGNRGVGIHRIFLDPAGSDRAVAKMRLGSSNDPACIRLFADDDVSYGLAISEGIETSLAVARLYAPVWATIDAGQMAKFPVLAGVETLSIFADHDRAGILAAAACADRWRAAGRAVIATAPRRKGADVNDLVREACDG